MRLFLGYWRDDIITTVMNNTFIITIPSDQTSDLLSDGDELSYGDAMTLLF
jgi:hypothetical protein